MQARMGCRAMVVALALVVGALGVVTGPDSERHRRLDVQRRRPTWAAGTPAMTFKQDGETITGTYVGTFGNATFKGTVKGTAIEFSFTAEAQGQTIDVVYKGTVEKDTMKGTVAMAGGQLNGTFTGKRK